MRTLIKIGFGLLALAALLIGLMFSFLRTHGSSSHGNPEGRVLASETRSITEQATEIDL